MNNTLTGLGLALVLALLAALIGPWFVNWSAYRDDFAREASALIGAPVSVTGAIDARLLPSPYLRVRGLTAGSGARALSVDEVEVTLAIAPLLRGEVKAERLRLVRPRIGVEVGADGTARTAFSGARKASSEAISFEAAEISDGSVAVTSPAGVTSLTRVDGVAEAGSLSGPYRFEGDLTAAGSRIGARLSTARLDDKNAMRVKLALKREGRPETLDIDGGLTIAAKPVFDGRAVLARAEQRRAGAATRLDGQALRVVAELKADPAKISANALDIAYGPDDRGVRLGGKGAITLGAKPAYDVALGSRQIDLDRIAGDGRPKTPAALVSAFADAFGSSLQFGGDGRATLDVRSVVLARDVIQNVVAEVATEAGGWRLKRAKAELPGGTTVSGAGFLAFESKTPGFSGDVDFATSDLSGFRRWLAGGEEISAPVRNLALKGRVSAGAESVAIEDAALTVEGARSKGRLAWRAAKDGARGRVEAALTSDDLDLDALGLDRLVSRAFDAGGLDAAIALDAKSLTFAGVAMSGVSIDGTAGSDGVDLKRLEIRDAGGARISGAGRITQGEHGLAGHLSADVAAERAAPLVALARALGAPQSAADVVSARGAALAPLKLQIDVDAGVDRRSITAKGDAAGGKLDLKLSARELSFDAPAELELKLASPDGKRLAALAGLEASPVARAEGGEITIRLAGATARSMSGEGRFAALGIDAKGRGSVAIAPVAGFSAEGEVTVSSADLSALGEAIGRLTPGASPRLPGEFSGKLAYGPEEIRLEDVRATVAGVAMRGRATASRDGSKPISGTLDFDELPTSAIAALALSPSVAASSERSGWSSAGFGPALARGLSGRIEAAAARAPLVPGQVATDARFTLALRPGGVAIENFSAALDGGKLRGSANLTRSGDDATVSFSGSLENFDLARLAADSALAGNADFTLEAQATGRSPSGLVDALNGAGLLTIRNAALRGLDVGAIDRVEPKVESSLELDAAKVAGMIDRDLSGADLAFAEIAAPFTLSGGVARTGSLNASNDAARLGGGAALDLRRATLDADLTLQPNRPDAPQIGVSFEGPIAAPVRRIDATALTSWLSVRAVERETKRIEAMEADIQERAKVARARAEEARKKAEEEKRRAEEERRKAEAERRKRETDARALIDAIPKPGPSTSPGLPPTLDITPPGLATPKPPPAPPGGAFGPVPATRGGSGRTPPDALSMPQSILPPAAVSPGR